MLKFLVSVWDYRNFPEFSCGQLTQERVRHISNEFLAQVCHKMQLDQFLVYKGGWLGKWRESNGKGTRPNEESKVWSDMVEAMIGALFVEQGMIGGGEEFGVVGMFVKNVILCK